MAVAEDVQRILALEYLLDEVRHDMTHGQPYIAAKDLLLAQRPPFADADAVERPDDRERQLILLPGALCVVFRRQFLEAVGRGRRRTAALLALRRRPDRRVLEHHRRTDDVDLFQCAALKGADGR